ncbi:D-arabinono-1,4-lactone oxidase [Sphingobacterium haloxyli]|uniref:Oxidoreductase n=1 Tax=Sphingobacterium haloxyli TaxID=2100533 RepID=A0A2S9J2C6_9SPHI|nr:D-arabinono-1,4-lactone oxidase [Sphingobacterium haloxyli]PRD46936.1 oxidoreductase [Sphingobacterium haloxyli]
MAIFGSNSNKSEQHNWAGNLRFTPAEYHVADGERELISLLKTANQKGKIVRSVGARHSCSPIIETDDMLLSLEKFNRLHAVDDKHLEATVGAGMTVEEVGKALFKHHLAMENTGHIDQQSLAGAICTGTHGAGKGLTNLSGPVAAIKLVTGTGEPRVYHENDHPDIMRALRVSLGALGIFTEITLKVLPAFRLKRQHFCTSVEDCLKHLPELMEENRNFGFYWYPRRDEVSLRLWNELGMGTQDLPYARLDKEEVGWSQDLLPTPHELRYVELEYSLGIEEATDCFMEIRERILKKHRKEVGWRLLFRPVAGDDNYLSNAYGRPTVAITIHQNACLPYEAYFKDIEQIFQAYDSRPHWGKMHSMTARELKHCYPEWDTFQRIREEFDPNNILLTPYLKRILIAS